MKEFFVYLAVLIFMVFLVVVFISNFPEQDLTQTESPVNSTEATLSDRLEFPEGWHLAEAYAYSFQVSGPYVVYICVNTAQTEYRICTPKVSSEQ